MSLTKHLIIIKRKTIDYQSYAIRLKLSNGHSPQIRQNGELLVRMCRMRVTFWRMSANVSASGHCLIKTPIFFDTNFPCALLQHFIPFSIIN
jgi:hypothetical protein